MNLETALINPRTLTCSCVKQLLMIGIADHADHRFAVTDHRQRDAPVRQAVDEADQIGAAVVIGRPDGIS